MKKILLFLLLLNLVYATDCQYFEEKITEIIEDKVVIAKNEKVVADPLVVEKWETTIFKAPTIKVTNTFSQDIVIDINYTQITSHRLTGVSTYNSEKHNVTIEKNSFVVLEATHGFGNGYTSYVDLSSVKYQFVEPEGLRIRNVKTEKIEKICKQCCGIDCIDDFKNCSQDCQCGSGKCENGFCVKQCDSLNECSEGTKTCEGNAFKTCIYSSDGCYKWSVKTLCNQNEVCVDGACVSSQSAPSIQIKRTNEGIVGVKSAEIIFDVVNVDFSNSLEGFLLCKSPDDAVVSSTMGVGVGSGAQYVSPRFIIDSAPSQKSITLTIDSDTAGEKRTECLIKYAFFKELASESGVIRKYVKNDGTLTTELQDSFFKELRLDKSVLFKNVETTCVKKDTENGTFIERLKKWLSCLFGGI